MTIQSDNKGKVRSLVSNMWAQMAILAIVLIIVIALAVEYLR